MNKNSSLSPSLALRLVDWLVVGVVILSAYLAGMSLIALLWQRFSLSQLRLLSNPMTPGLWLVFIVLLVGLCLFAGGFIDQNRRPLSIFAPRRFWQHFLFGALLGLLLSPLDPGIFIPYDRANVRDLAWAGRELCSLAMLAVAYWLAYQLPERIQSVPPH